MPFVYEVHNFLFNGFWRKGLKVKMGTNILISGMQVKQKGKDNRLYIGNGTQLCISGNITLIKE